MRRFAASEYPLAGIEGLCGGCASFFSCATGALRAGTSTGAVFRKFFRFTTSVQEGAPRRVSRGFTTKGAGATFFALLPDPLL